MNNDRILRVCDVGDIPAGDVERYMECMIARIPYCPATNSHKIKRWFWNYGDIIAIAAAWFFTLVTIIIH